MIKYSKELENLISTAIYHGVLDEKDREALCRRAQVEGVDMNEFEIHLNSVVKQKRHEWYEEAKARNLAEYEKSKRSKHELTVEDPIQTKVQHIIDEAIKADLYPEKLILLLKDYLADGILTEKERQVILNKAETLGVNRDEMDLFLDAQVQKLEEVSNSEQRKRRGKSCPFCGAPVPQLADKCPECEKFITPEATEELEDILEHLEDALVDYKSGHNTEKSKANIERYSRKAELYYSNHPKIKVLLAEVSSEKKIVEKEMSSKARKDAVMKWTLKNKWFWASLPFFIAAILFVISLCIDSKKNTIETLQFVAGVLVLAGCYGLFFAGKEYLDKGLEKNIEIMDKYKNLFK